MSMRMTSASWTAQHNGTFSPNDRTPSGSVSGWSQAGAFPSSSKMTSSGRGQSNKISLVHDFAIAIKRKSALELGSGVLQSVGETSFIKLVQWIRAERLSTLPHQGSEYLAKTDVSRILLTDDRHLGHRPNQSSLCSRAPAQVRDSYSRLCSWNECRRRAGLLSYSPSPRARS